MKKGKIWNVIYFLSIDGLPQSRSAINFSIIHQFNTATGITCRFPDSTYPTYSWLAPPQLLFSDDGWLFVYIHIHNVILYRLVNVLLYYRHSLWHVNQVNTVFFVCVTVVNRWHKLLQSSSRIHFKCLQHINGGKL